MSTGDFGSPVELLSNHKPESPPKLHEANEPECSAAGGRYGSDIDLQTAKRIDWRFLLPSPRLRRVAYLGSEVGTLVAALSRFSEALAVISPLSEGAGEQAKGPSFDLVVLCSRCWADVRKASSILRGGGYLYWEIDRRNWLALLRRITASERSKEQGVLLLHDCVGSLQRLGFCDIEVNWHRPNFEECVEIIPLNDQSAVKFVFSRQPNGLLSRLKLAAGRGLMKAGLIARLAPCLSVIARKHEASSKLL